MKKLKITIEGAPATGKTTLSLLIADVLMRAGFGVNNEDFDVVEGCAYPHLQEMRLKALAEADTIVDIVTGMWR